MTVQVKQSAVASGSTGSVFDNDGGLLRVSETDVSNVTASALIATANNGASFLELSTVSCKYLKSGNIQVYSCAVHTNELLCNGRAVSDMNSITFSTAGGSQSVMNTTVGKMIHMEDAFYVEGVGSTLLVDGTFVQNNTNQTVPWRVVSVRTEAIARVSASSISDNTAVEFGVVAFNSTVSIEDSFISRNSGSVRHMVWEFLK